MSAGAGLQGRVTPRRSHRLLGKTEVSIVAIDGVGGGSKIGWCWQQCSSVTVTVTVTVGIEAVGVRNNRGWDDRGRRIRSRNRDRDGDRDRPFADDDTVVVSVINLARPPVATGPALSPRKRLRDVGHVDMAITTTTPVAWCSRERTGGLALSLVVIELLLLVVLLSDALLLDGSLLLVVVLLVGGSSRSGPLALLGGGRLGFTAVLGSAADVAPSTDTLPRGGDSDVVGLQQSLVTLGTVCGQSQSSFTEGGDELTQRPC